MRQFKLDLMASFMGIEAVNSKLKQGQIAKELGWTSSTLQRYRNDINMLSPHRIAPDSHKRKQKTSYRKHDLERP